MYLHIKEEKQVISKEGSSTQGVIKHVIEWGVPKKNNLVMWNDSWQLVSESSRVRKEVFLK